MEKHCKLLSLLPLVTMRIKHRLGDWPATHREDVEQDCIVKLLKVINDPVRLAKIERLEAYAQRLIDYTVNDAIRAHARQRHMVLLDHELAVSSTPPDDCDPSDVATDNELAAGLDLTPKQQRLFDLRRTLGSTSAVAAALDIDTQAASERLSRLFRVIRDQRHGNAA